MQFIAISTIFWYVILVKYRVFCVILHFKNAYLKLSFSFNFNIPPFFPFLWFSAYLISLCRGKRTTYTCPPARRYCSAKTNYVLGLASQEIHQNLLDTLKFLGKHRNICRTSQELLAQGKSALALDHILFHDVTSLQCFWFIVIDVE